MAGTTLIKNADWVVGYDPDRDGHVYMRGADVAFSNDTIIHIGRDYGGEAEHVIDGKDVMVLPGMLDLHLHGYMEMHGKGFFEDLATKHMWMTQLLEYTWILQEDPESAAAATQASACDLLKSGCTTMAELHCSGLPYQGWIDVLAGTGIRTYACPMVQSAHWYTSNGQDHLYEWYEEKGFENLERSLELIDDAIAHPSGRLHGMVGPAQADTCTEELFRRCKEAADSRGIPLQTHAAQSVMEHREMESRVTISGPLPQAELAVAMARARLLVLPSYSEGLPKVLVEAMLCGTPVLATAVNGIPEIVEDGVSGWLVPPGDVYALADKMVHALQQADLDRMGERAREFASGYFSAETYVKHYGDLFVLAWNEARR